jgi:hypothetical protein
LSPSVAREGDIHLVELEGILLARMVRGHGSIPLQHIGDEVEAFRLRQVLRPLWNPVERVELL